MTACTLFDAQSFWESWLTDLSIDQDEEMGVSTVVPDVARSTGSRATGGRDGPHPGQHRSVGGL